MGHTFCTLLLYKHVAMPSIATCLRSSRVQKVDSLSCTYTTILQYYKSLWEVTETRNFAKQLHTHKHSEQARLSQLPEPQTVDYNPWPCVKKTTANKLQLFTREHAQLLSLIFVFSQCNIMLQLSTYVFHCCLSLHHCCLALLIKIVLCKFLCTCTITLMLLVNNVMNPKNMQ